jgi:hypothetical protein
VSQQAEADEEGVLVAKADTLDRLDTDDELLTEPEEVGLTLRCRYLRRSEYRSLWWCPRRCLGHWAC